MKRKISATLFCIVLGLGRHIMGMQSIIDYFLKKKLSTTTHARNRYLKRAENKITSAVICDNKELVLSIFKDVEKIINKPFYNKIDLFLAPDVCKEMASVTRFHQKYIRLYLDTIRCTIDCDRMALFTHLFCNEIKKFDISYLNRSAFLSANQYYLKFLWSRQVADDICLCRSNVSEDIPSSVLDYLTSSISLPACIKNLCFISSIDPRWLTSTYRVDYIDDRKTLKETLLNKARLHDNFVEYVQQGANPFFLNSDPHHNMAILRWAIQRQYIEKIYKDTETQKIFDHLFKVIDKGTLYNTSFISSNKDSNASMYYDANQRILYAKSKNELKGYQVEMFSDNTIYMLCHLACLFERCLEPITQAIMGAKKQAARVDALGRTPLHLAVLNQNSKAVQMFLDHDNVNVYDKTGLSAAGYAVLSRNLDCLNICSRHPGFLVHQKQTYLHDTCTYLGLIKVLSALYGRPSIYDALWRYKKRTAISADDRKNLLEIDKKLACLAMATSLQHKSFADIVLVTTNHGLH